MDLRRRIEIGRWVLAGLGGLTVLYCIAVLGFVATAPDLGLRCLLSSTQLADPESTRPGLEVRQITRELARDRPTLASDFGEGPAPGDRLLKIAGRPAHTFAHFAARLAELRTAKPFGGKLAADAS